MWRTNCSLNCLINRYNSSQEDKFHSPISQGSSKTSSSPVSLLNCSAQSTVDATYCIRPALEYHFHHPWSLFETPIQFCEIFTSSYLLSHIQQPNRVSYEGEIDWLTWTLSLKNTFVGCFYSQNLYFFLIFAYKKVKNKKISLIAACSRYPKFNLLKKEMLHWRKLLRLPIFFFIICFFNLRNCEKFQFQNGVIFGKN